jgi:hypothetical protein
LGGFIRFQTNSVVLKVNFSPIRNENLVLNKLSLQKLLRRKKKFMNELIEILEANAPNDDSMYFCRLHDLFSENGIHSPIFCNLSDDFVELNSFLLTCSNQLAPDLFFKLYIFLLNNIVEKVIQTQEVIGYTDGLNHLKLVRRWANFFKHPKSFFLVHHPEFVSNDYLREESEILIDSDFVMKYYCNQKLDIELIGMLQNKTNVKVQLPNLASLTTDFCQDICLIIAEINKSPENIKKLENIMLTETQLNRFIQQDY